MDYDFSKFDAKKFEHLIQALLQNILGYSSIVFGDGKDGARELTYEGESDFPSKNNRWGGYWVVQAKFKSKDFEKTQNFMWVRKNFEEELKKFLDKGKGLKKPDNYLFFTNVTLTPVHKTGGRDNIEIIKEKYKEFINNIFIGGYNEVCSMLDNNESVRITYSEFLLTSDLISRLLEKEPLRQQKYDEYEDYKKLEEEINALKKENNANIQKIIELERQKETLVDALKKINYFIENFSNEEIVSTLLKKAIWLFYIEKDIDGALQILNDAEMEKQEVQAAECRILKGQMLFAKLNFKEAKINFKKALRIVDNYETNLELASFLLAMKKYKKAIPFYENAYLFADDLEKIKIANDLGNIYKKIGDHYNTEKYYFDALNLIPHELNATNVHLTFAPILNLANYYSEIENLTMAKKLYNVFIKFDKIIVKFLLDHDIAVIYGNIGILFYEDNKLERAKKYLNKSLEILNKKEKNIQDIEHYCHFSARLGDVYAHLGDFKNAEKHYLDALNLMEQVAIYVPEVFLTTYAKLIVDIVVLYCYFLKNPQEEITKLITILKNVEPKWYNKVDCQLGNCLYHQSMVYWKGGMIDYALNGFEDAKKILISSKQKHSNKDRIIELINDSISKIKSEQQKNANNKSV